MNFLLYYDDDDDYDSFDTFDTSDTPYDTPYTSDNNDDDDNADMPDLETKEEAAERIADPYGQKKESKRCDDDRIKNLKDKILDLETKLNYQLKKRINYIKSLEIIMIN